MDPTLDEIRKDIRVAMQPDRATAVRVGQATIKLTRIIDKLRKQNAVQAEQLDRLADMVPRANAYANNVRYYLKEQGE